MSTATARPADVDDSDAVLPSWYAAAHTRNFASAALHRIYRLHAHGAFHTGTADPLVLVVPGRAVLTGLIVQAVAPRPVHVLADATDPGALPAVLRRATGAIDVDTPTAVGAQHRARAALADGRAVAVCGRIDVAAYLVAVTGAPVAPVVLLGADGRVGIDPPRPGSTIDAYFSAPVTPTVPGDPLRVATRAAIGEFIRQVCADATDQAHRRAGRPTKGWR